MVNIHSDVLSCDCYFKSVPRVEMNAWTNEKILQFINELYLHRELWDVKSLEYRDRLAKMKSWAAIAVKFGVRSDEAHKKFKSLRTYAKNEHKKKKNAGGGNKHVTWFAYEAISFLFANESKNGADESINISDDFEEIVPKVESIDVDEVEILEMSDYLEPPNLFIRKKKRKKTEKDGATPEKNAKKNRQAKNLKNVLSSFVEHISAKMKTYDRHTRAEVEYKISKVIYEADMKTLWPEASGLGVTSPTSESRAPLSSGRSQDFAYLLSNSNSNDSFDNSSL